MNMFKGRHFGGETILRAVQCVTPAAAREAGLQSPRYINHVGI